MTEYKYRAFISYSHADARFTKWLHAKLEKFSIDRDLVGRKTDIGLVPHSLRPIFRDRDEFTAGQTLKDQTIKALDASATLIVVCSPKAAHSRYVNEEIRLFKQGAEKRPIIPIIVDGIPNDAKHECFPLAMKFEIAEDGTPTSTSLELLAADPRETGDGPNLALAKVVACVLGLDTDEVFRRAERERRRQNHIWSLIVTLIVVLTMSVSFFYWRSIRNQQTIDDFVSLVDEYSYVDPNQANESAVRKDLKNRFKDIAEGSAIDPRYAKARELIRAKKPEDAIDLLRDSAEDEAARIHRLNKRVAEKFRNLGAIARLADPRQARDAYSKAFHYDPGDTESMYWNGYLNLLAGNLDLSEGALKQLLAVAVTTKSSNDLYRAHLRLGEIELRRGIFSSSLQHQEEALRIAQSSLESVPTSTDWKRDRSVVLEKIGDLHLIQGEADRALEIFDSSLSIRDDLVRNNPNDEELQRLLAIAHIKAGDALDRLREWNRALKSYEAALGIAEHFAQKNPKNVGWQRLLGLSHERIGMVQFSQRNFENAMKSYRLSLEIRENVAKADPRNTDIQRDISISQEKLGNALEIEGKAEEALEQYKLAIRIRELLVNADPKNAQSHIDLAMSYGNLAGLYLRRGEKLEALKYFRAGRTILASPAERSGNSHWRKLLQDFEDDIADLEH